MRNILHWPAFLVDDVLLPGGRGTSGIDETTRRSPDRLHGDAKDDPWWKVW
jgi:hypothetical protein